MLLAVQAVLRAMVGGGEEDRSVTDLILPLQRLEHGR